MAAVTEPLTGRDREFAAQARHAAEKSGDAGAHRRAAVLEEIAERTITAGEGS